MKYEENVDLKKYNTFEALEVNMKLVIPENEENGEYAQHVQNSGNSINHASHNQDNTQNGVPEYNDPDYMPPQDGDYIPIDEMGGISSEDIELDNAVIEEQKYIMGKPSKAKEKHMKIKDKNLKTFIKDCKLF